MTPKEKAKELFDKYQIAGSQWYVDTTKKYALIAVDEILLHIEISYYNEHIIEGAKKYWTQVRHEIKKL